MAITAGTGVAASGVLTTSFTLVMGAVSAGTSLWLACVNRDSTAAPSISDDDTGGNSWTHVHGQNADTNGSLHIYHKFATSGTGGKTITGTGFTGSCCAVWMPYTGVHQSTPYGTPTGEADASANELNAGITTTAANSFVLLFVCATDNDTNISTASSTSPGTLTDRVAAGSTGGGDCQVEHFSALKAATGATGNVTWSRTDGTGASVVIELLEAPAGYTLAADGGSYSVTGTAASLEFGAKVIADAGSYSLTGTAASLEFGRALIAESGSYAISGTDASLEFDRKLSADGGSYALSGTDASLEFGRKVIAGSGAYVLTGSDVTFTLGGNKTLVAGSGTYTLTGTDVTFELVTVAAPREAKLFKLIRKEVDRGSKRAKMTVAATLVKLTPGSRTAGALSAGTNPSSTSLSARGFLVQRKVDKVDGVLVEKEDRIVALIGKSIQTGAAPKTKDKITIYGETLRVVAVETDPARAVYTCLARR